MPVLVSFESFKARDSGDGTVRAAKLSKVESKERHGFGRDSPRTLKTMLEFVCSRRFPWRYQKCPPHDPAMLQCSALRFRNPRPSPMAKSHPHHMLILRFPYSFVALTLRTVYKTNSTVKIMRVLFHTIPGPEFVLTEKHPRKRKRRDLKLADSNACLIG